MTQNFEIYGAQSESDLKFLQNLGFTQVIVDLLQFAEPADKLGLGVVLANFWDSSTTPSQVAEVVSLANGLEHLVSINMMDEPILVGLATHAPAVYLRIRDWIRRGGSNAPLSLTEYGPRPDWPVSWSRVYLDFLEAIDIVRSDPYPFAAGRPLELVAQWIDQARLLIGVTGRPRPLTVILQAWACDNGLPPVPMIRMMAYLAMLSGVETLSFYQYNPADWDKVPGFTADFTAMMVELTALAQEFAGAEVQGVLGVDHIFQAEIRRDRQWTCISVNTLNRPNGRFGPLEVIRHEGRCARPYGVTAPPAVSTFPTPAIQRRDLGAVPSGTDSSGMSSYSAETRYQ
jgi:hypothetical protein